VPAGDPPTDPFLAEVLAAIRSGTRSEKAKSAVEKLDKQVGGLWHRLVERMVAAGTLGEDKHGRLMPTRHPVLDRPRQDSVLGSVRASAAGDGPLVARSAVLLALTGPCRLLERVAPDRSGRRHAKARIKQAPLPLPPSWPAPPAATADRRSAAETMPGRTGLLRRLGSRASQVGGEAHGCGNTANNLCFAQ
jgi:Golgi phosphoprotein 3 (GPP34)